MMFGPGIGGTPSLSEAPSYPAHLPAPGFPRAVASRYKRPGGDAVAERESRPLYR
jgi:hypothetical protein